jgi:hypothetical protein
VLSDRIFYKIGKESRVRRGGPGGKWGRCP